MIVDKIFTYITQKEKTLDESLSSQVGYIAKYAFQRQFMLNSERKGGVLYLSSCGNCQRQQAYKFWDYPVNGKEQDSRSKMVFWLGDLAEFTVIGLAKSAGLQVTACGLNQATVYLRVGDTLIAGHPDGLLLQDGEIILLEVKSMTTYKYKDFERGEIDEAYLDQTNAYLAALGLRRAIMVALNKESGILNERMIDRDDKRVERIKARLGRVLTSKKEELPKAEYTFGEDGKYPWNCLYCGYWRRCKPNAEQVLVGQKYILKEKN